VRSKADLSASFQKCQTAPSTPICWALLSTWQLISWKYILLLG
jgi:hypothetical protein